MNLTLELIPESAHTVTMPCSCSIHINDIEKITGGEGGEQSKGTSLSSSDFNMNDSISTHHHHPQILPDNLNLLEAHCIVIYNIYNRYTQWKTLSCGSGDGSVGAATVS